MPNRDDLSNASNTNPGRADDFFRANGAGPARLGQDSMGMPMFPNAQQGIAQFNGGGALDRRNEYLEELKRQLPYIKSGGIIGRPMEDIEIWFNEDSNYRLSENRSRIRTTPLGGQEGIITYYNVETGKIATFRVKSEGGRRNTGLRIIGFEER